MKQFSIRYRGFWIWRRAEIFDGVRWIRMDEDCTKRQIQADELYAANQKIIDRLDACIAANRTETGLNLAKF